MAVSDITEVSFQAYSGATPISLPVPFAPTVNGNQVMPFSVRIVGIFEGGPVNASCTITDPLGVKYKGYTRDGATTLEQGVSVKHVGTYLLEFTITDSTGSKTFPFELAIATQYNSGGGQMRDIPLTSTGEARPPWDWLPGAGYYNPGNGVMKPGNTPSPISDLFHCDLITRQCRPKNLGSPMACEVYPPDRGYNNTQIMERISPPLREIPAGLLAHKRSRDQSTCWCWAIKPRYGEWEGYTSLDRNISLPAYTDSRGNHIPSMEYICAAGITPTAIPTHLALGKGAPDMTVLAFDRVKLQTQYYTGAEYEVFELNYLGDLSERWVGSSGKLGNTSITDNSATIELTPWVDVAARPIGREVTVYCDVGSQYGEEFGTGRCRNQALHDGPAKDDWTIPMTRCGDPTKNSMIIWGDWAGNWTASLYQPPMVTKSGQPVPDNWHLHLRGGKVLFTSGKNKGIERDIQTASRFAIDHTLGWGNLAVHFHIPLPFVPDVNDTYEVTAGCDRTLQDCAFYNNVSNFRGFPDIPGREGVLRRFKA